METIARLILSALALVFAAGGLAQSNYPEKPIRIVVGFPSGSSVDVVGRLLAQRLSESLGKAVIVENVLGVAGSIAAERVVRAAPDGYTLLLSNNGQIVINPGLYRLAYDPAVDLAPISHLCEEPHLLVVHNGVAAKSVGELIALAKSQPGMLTFASGGNGSSPHMTAELFKASAGVSIQAIPYKGVVAAVPDLLSGRITMIFSPLHIVVPLAREGKLRPLAVSSARRSPAMPELPTIDESGFPGFVSNLWNGLLAPAKTPSAVVRRLHGEVLNALARPDVRTRLADIGFEVTGSSPEEFAAAIRSETPKWAKLIKDAGIKPDE
jgi:tripartite-type tricarboxylate transporter receptor subunit TctC